MLLQAGLEFSLPLLPTVVGVALDAVGNRKVQLFRHNNTGGFLFCP